MSKLGKNEAKRLQAAALREFHSEMDEDERERMLRRGMGGQEGGLIHKGVDQLVAKKLSKEEKKAMMEQKRAALAEKKAAKMAAKEGEASEAQAKQGERQSGERESGERGGGDRGDRGDRGDEGDGDEGEETEPEGGESAVQGASMSGVKNKGGASTKAKGRVKGGAAAKKGVKKEAVVETAYPQLDGILVASAELPFHQRTGPHATKRASMQMDIKIGGIRMCAGKQELLDHAVLALNYGVKYGLVGRNGVGKTTLLRHLADGRIPLPPFINVVHVEQEIPFLPYVAPHFSHISPFILFFQEIAGDDRSALATITDADEERQWLLALEQKLLDGDEETERAYKITLNEVYERLEELDSDNAEARAAQLLSGLGFDNDMQGKATREYSGGWRMRIVLAQALFLKPDLLLLDEPTNHLDVHALTWLEFFLAQWDRTVLIVSHDRGFLNKVTRATMFIHGKRLRYYGGNYDTFLKVRAEHRAMNEAHAKQQNQRVSHLKQFIARFGQGHKKMAKQAQARMKILAKLQDEPCEVDFDDPYLRLNFPSASTLPPPCISVVNVAFGYEEGKTLYRGCDFGLDCESRVAIVGPNGAGKSTFLKLLTGEIQPTEGHVGRHAKLMVAKFTQHHIDSMDLTKSSVNHMRDLTKEVNHTPISPICHTPCFPCVTPHFFPIYQPPFLSAQGVSIEESRKYLGRFGLSGDLALNPIECLSGGQKSRLAFAELAWRSPHILLLDEPTNHLDLETIEALAMAINHFDGGVVFVTHDERLIEICADELWVVNKGKNGEPGTVTVWHGSYGEYRNKLEQEFLNSGLVAQGTVKGVGK
tara:strand:+ start:11334 stop:13796 length:2463 start_codon:yes stop_codon:yes gene_type:complete